MTLEQQVINIAVCMGYKYDKNTQPKDSLANGILSFDGFGEQRVTVYLASPLETTYMLLGRGLIEYGERKKINEIKKSLQITN